MNSTTKSFENCEVGQGAPAVQKKPVRRVGTLTMGIALIITGIVITLSMLVPSIDLTLALKLCPLLLVLLGLEVIYFSMRRSDDTIKYDFLSMFVCFFLICGSFGMSLIPQFIRYYGPARETTAYRLESQLNSRCAAALSGNSAVRSCDGGIYLETMEFDEKSSIEDVDYAYISLTVELGDRYALDKQSFAEAAVSVRDQLIETGIAFDSIYLYADDNQGHRMNLNFEGGYLFDRTAAQLVEEIETEGIEDTADWASQSASPASSEMPSSSAAEQPAA